MQIVYIITYCVVTVHLCPCKVCVSVSDEWCFQSCELIETPDCMNLAKTIVKCEGCLLCS